MPKKHPATAMQSSVFLQLTNKQKAGIRLSNEEEAHLVKEQRRMMKPLSDTFTSEEMDAWCSNRLFCSNAMMIKRQLKSVVAQQVDVFFETELITDVETFITDYYHPLRQKYLHFYDPTPDLQPLFNTLIILGKQSMAVDGMRCKVIRQILSLLEESILNFLIDCVPPAPPFIESLTVFSVAILDAFNQMIGHYYRQDAPRDFFLPYFRKVEATLPRLPPTTPQSSSRLPIKEIYFDSTKNEKTITNRVDTPRLCSNGLSPSPFVVA